MPAIWDRVIFYVSAILSGLATLLLVTSATSPLPAAGMRMPRDRIVTIDSWCNPTACTSIGKSVRPRID